MVLVVENKKMEGVWWKYGVMFALLHVIPWCLVGYKFDPEWNLFRYLAAGWQLMTLFAIGAFLPFTAMRLGWSRIFWTGLIGYVLGVFSYYILIFFEPLRALPNFAILPSTAWFQLDVLFVSLGVILEFGRYVLKKVYEE
jgi:hypothetical protein